MASDGKIPESQAPAAPITLSAAAAQAVPTSAAAGPAASGSRSGVPLPGTGSTPTAEPMRGTSPAALVTFLNQYLNDSGFPDQFRVDPTSAANIQEINPANGKVIAEYPAAEFPALARSVGLTRGLVDSSA